MERLFATPKTIPTFPSSNDIVIIRRLTPELAVRNRYHAGKRSIGVTPGRGRAVPARRLQFAIPRRAEDSVPYFARRFLRAISSNPRPILSSPLTAQAPLFGN